MSYARRNMLISRPGYSGMGDIWDTITGVAGGVVKAYGTAEQQAGAAAQAQRDLALALQAQQGPGIGTYLAIGGLGIAAILLLRRRAS